MLVRHYARSLAALRCVCTRRHVGTVNSIVSSTMECGPGTPPRARFSSDARGVTGSLAPPPPGNSELASLVQTVNDLMEQLKPSDTLRPSPSYSPFVAAIKACLNEGVPSLGLVERIAAQDVPMKISFELATLCMKSIVVAGPRALPIASRLADVLAEQHVFPDVTTCDGVITIASNNGQNELVVKLFEYMAKSGLDATQRSCLKAAESYAVLGRPEVGARLLTHLCDTSTDAIPPQAFDTVIQGLHGVGRLEDAFALFQLASGRNVNVRISASLPILQAFSHDAGRVLAIFRHFLRFGSLSKPKDREKVTHALVTIPESVQLPKLLSLLGSANVHPTADENLTNTLLTVFTAVSVLALCIYIPCMPLFASSRAERRLVVWRESVGCHAAAWPPA